MLSSDDFRHDVQLQVSGDFGDATTKLAYGRFLADVLTQGCRRARAAEELADTDGLLKALTQAARGPQSGLLRQLADELAALRTALADAQRALEGLQGSSYNADKAAKAGAPSALALALSAALRGTTRD